MNTPVTIAYFITDHGFGHASRAAAVMAAVSNKVPQVCFELFTTCPKWIFTDSLQVPFGYHAVQVDVGVVQTSPLAEDLAATSQALDRWLPFDDVMVETLAEQTKALACQLVVCDISPLGIAVARKAGIPSVLVENFTWDWIYCRYAVTEPRLKPHAEYLQRIYQQVDHRLQTQPLCNPIEGLTCIGPISRAPRSKPDEIRSRLQIPNEATMVSICMGGIPDRFEFLSHLSAVKDLYLVVPGASENHVGQDHVILLPTRSDFFHPDLLYTADVLIGKAGYSTIAEAYWAGVPYGYIPRPRSPESAALEYFADHQLSAQPISAETYASGDWMQILPELLSQPRTKPPGKNGADVVANNLIGLIG